jgi:peptide/nickel transport system substrate-binding protein
MKKLLFISLIAILAFVLVLGSCAKEETPAPAPAAPAAPAPAAPTPAKPAPAAPAPAAPAPAKPAPAAPAAKAGPYGTIRVADVDYGWESTDPVYYESFIGWSIYDSLLGYDAQGNFVPDVAEKWEISPDGNTWTFHIRHGIKFHNGDPLTAADVKFSVDRFGDMSLSTNPWSWYISPQYNKKDSKVVDDYTYQFVSDHPEPNQAVVFAWTRILPKKYYESIGMDAFRKKPIGSGPWKFVNLIPKTSYKLEANTDYWIPDAVPAFQYYQSYMMPEQATRIASLKAGETDITFVDFDRIKDLVNQGFRTEKVGLPMQNNINFQGTWLKGAGAVGDIRVRQAMSYALNRQEICDTWFQGYAKPGGMWFMWDQGYGWSDALKSDPYDPAKAKALLAEAGYPGKFADPTVHLYTTAPAQDFILLLINYWKAVGLQAKIEVVDSTVWGSYFFSFNRIKEGDPNVGWIFDWALSDVMNATYQSSNMYGSWGVHNTGNDPKADELYKKATLELDPVKAKQYWTEFQAYARTMYVDVGIALADPLVIVSQNLGEFTGKVYMGLYDCANGIKHPK